MVVMSISTNNLSKMVKGIQGYMFFRNGPCIGVSLHHTKTLMACPTLLWLVHSHKSEFLPTVL